MVEWWKETIAVTKRLASSKVYIYQNLSTAFFLFGIMGFAQFIPKYMEYHFRIRASTSGASGGIPKTFASVGKNFVYHFNSVKTLNILFYAVGLLVSGWVMSRWRFKARTLAGWCVFSDVLAIVAICSMSLFACPQSHFPNIDESRSGMVFSDCNANCGCEGIPYNPVCSNEDGLTNYFSPCHAGCQSFEIDENNNTIFKDCKCLNGADLPPPSLVPLDSYVFQNGTASTGVCPVSCMDMFYALIGFMFVFSIVGSTTRIPNFLLSMRSIPIR